jgi:hypothetical protein
MTDGLHLTSFAEDGFDWFVLQALTEQGCSGPASPSLSSNPPFPRLLLHKDEQEKADCLADVDSISSKAWDSSHPSNYLSP